MDAARQKWERLNDELREKSGASEKAAALLKAEEEKIKDFEIEDGKVTFEAAGFSVYAVVASPDPYDPETKEHVLSLEELAEDLLKRNV